MCQCYLRKLTLLCCSVYSGFQIEDATQGYLVFRKLNSINQFLFPQLFVSDSLDWNSLQDLHTGRASTAYETLLKLSGDSVVNVFVVPNPKPAENIPIVLGTPVSEFAVAKLILEENRDKWEACLKATLDGVKITKGAVAGIRATEEKDPNTYVFVIGWSSVEVWFSVCLSVSTLTAYRLPTGTPRGLRPRVRQRYLSRYNHSHRFRRQTRKVKTTVVILNVSIAVSISFSAKIAFTS